MTAKALTFLISTVVLLGLLFGFVVLSPAEPVRRIADPWAGVPRWPKPTDHAAFFTEPFPDGPSVTKACAVCHPNAAEEITATSHWTWLGGTATDPRTGQVVRIGKRNVQNNFCIGIAANWPRCTSCHIGYGYRDDSFFDTATAAQVDCLICHDGSGQYEKEPTGAGVPMKGVDLLASAKSVGRTDRSHCGSCHFKGGGGDGVKHGDLDESMYFPPARVDVHMGKHDLRCADCHQADRHRILGRLLPSSEDPETRVNCSDCHGETPHASDRMNAHVGTVACQTCHIPEYAVETGTKMWWDWSKAGLEGDPHEIADRLVAETVKDPGDLPPLIRDLFSRVKDDPNVYTHYDRKKGLFLIARRQRPEYRWYNRSVDRYLPGQKFEAGGTVAINRPRGEARDPKARIWPFKIHRGKQPFDEEHHHLLVPHTFGEGGYWKEFDWPSALAEGAKASGIEFSGKFGWVHTEMFWPQNHMVAVEEKSLGCTDCHGPGGRMDWKALGYPGDPATQGDRRQMDIVREEDR